MKGKGKRATGVMLALLILMMLVGCTPLGIPGTAPQTTPQAQSQTTKPNNEVNTTTPKEPVEIQFWHNYDAGAGQIDVLNELITKFESENEDVKVKQLYLEWSALKNNVVAGATTGMLPDVLRGDIGFVPQFQSLNVLAEMSAFPDYAQIAGNVLEAPNSSAKMNGKFYGIAANTNTKVLFYNKKMFADAGLSVPATQAEIWEAAKVLSKDRTIGFVEAWTGVWNVGPYIWSNGGDILAPDYSTATGYINSPIAVQTIQTLADLYKAKALTGPSMDPGAVGDTDGWAAGTYAMEVDGPWRDTLAKAANIDIGCVNLPAGTAGSTSVLGGEDFLMFKTSDAAHQDAAWRFIKFMVGREAQVAMAKVGQMPVNKEALADPEAIKAMPLLPVFTEALKTARARPVTPKWSDMENIIATKVAEAITGVKPVQTALDEAAAEIDQLIAQ